MAYDTRGKRGCGCCGPVGCVSGLLLIIVLSVAAFFVVRFAWYLSDQPLPVNQNTVPPGAYPQVRHRLNDFMGNAEIRSVLLSEADINAMLADAPELAFLGKGASIAFRETHAIYTNSPDGLHGVAGRLKNAPCLRRRLQYLRKLPRFMP